MITLPAGIAPIAATPRMVDYGFNQESAGGSAIRIDRPGNRFEVELQFAPLDAATARVFLSRIVAAKSAGLRVAYPLQGQAQGAPGAPLVDGETSSGRVLLLRGLTAGYTIKEGYWLNLIGPDGTYYLHTATGGDVIASGAGKATLAVEPPLRVIPADGWAIELVVPKIEGLVTSDVSWGLNPGDLASGVSITLREAA